MIRSRIAIALCIALFIGFLAVSLHASPALAQDTLEHPVNNNNMIPASGAAESKIAFVIYHDCGHICDQGEIYVIDPDGSNRTNLTNHPRSDTNPAWSPDGQRIAFERPWPPARIYVMNADGTNITELVDQYGQFPTWSPDGSEIAFRGEVNGQVGVYRMNSDGTGEVRLVALGEFLDLDWSPNGDRIVATEILPTGYQFTEISVINVDGTGQTRLTNLQPNNAYLPAWSPDGQKIAFTWNDVDWGDPEIYVMNADGTNQTRLTDGSGRDGGPSWSPDGEKIVFSSSRDGNDDLYVMDADGTNQTRLTYTLSPQWEQSAAWSPYIVFPLNISGTIRDADGNPIPDVMVSVENTPYKFETGNDGKYGFIALDPGTYTITPEREGYTFTPPTHEVKLSDSDIEDMDFTADLDLVISHIELTQATQNIAHTVPLIREKPTLARIYVSCRSDCGSIRNVTGEIRGYDAVGSALDPPVARYVNRTITVTSSDWSTHREDLFETLNFDLPREWLDQTIRLKASVMIDKYPRVEGLKTVELSESRPLEVFLVPIRYLGNTPNVAEFIADMYWPEMLLPMRPPIRLTMLGTLEWTKCLDTTCLLAGWNRRQLINELMALQLTPDSYVYGLLPQGDYGFSGYSDPEWADFPNPSRGIAAMGVYTPTGIDTFTHELGHLMGVRHTNTVANLVDPHNDQCTEFNLADKPTGKDMSDEEWRAAVDPDSKWPYQDSTIQDPGVQHMPTPSDPFERVSWSPKPSDGTYDYMSYCGSQYYNNVWTSSWTYMQIFENENRVAASENNLASDLSDRSILTISGSVGHDGTAILDPAWVSNSPKGVSPSTGSTWCLELRDSSENVGGEYCFDPDFVDYETGKSVGVDGFYATMPMPNALAEIVLLHEGTEVVSRTRTAHAPQVTVLKPAPGDKWKPGVSKTIRWNGHDEDGDSLHYRVEYSADGINWLPLGLTTEKSETTVDTDNIPGSNQARIRVTVSDGINTASDESDGKLVVGGKSPRVFVSSYLTGDNVSAANGIYLSGYGYDADDGQLIGDSLAWKSDYLGTLGTGSPLFVELPCGNHSVVLEAVDSDGNVASETIEILGGECTYLPTVWR